jgi:hypothetical protein
MKHTILTFITKVEPSKVEELREFLRTIAAAADLAANPHLPFGSLKSLHFASLVIHEDEAFGPYLIFENNFDGPLDAYLDELYENAAEGLHRIYSCCRDYPAGSSAERERILSYLRAHAVRPNACHIGNVGRSVERIRREEGLRDNLEDFLDGVVKGGRDKEPPGVLRQEVQSFARGRPDYEWVANAPPRQTWMERFLPRFNLILAALTALVLLPLIILPFIVWVIVLRRKEKRDRELSDLGNHEHVMRLVEREDRTHIVQNHLAHMTLVKPGRFRRATLRGVLWLVNLVARTSTSGTLLGIPSIHFAHWALIDDGRRLLFLSNFDGSWENYLDDFIDKASVGLTAIWSNTVDFPRTRFLFYEGSRNGTLFKAWARETQTYSNVWYSAYKSLTVQSVDNNSSIREDLLKPLDETATRSWLWRF